MDLFTQGHFSPYFVSSRRRCHKVNHCSSRDRGRATKKPPGEKGCLTVFTFLKSLILSVKMDTCWVFNVTVIILSQTQFCGAIYLHTIFFPCNLSHLWCCFKSDILDQVVWAVTRCSAELLLTAVVRILATGRPPPHCGCENSLPGGKRTLGSAYQIISCRPPVS